MEAFQAWLITNKFIFFYLLICFVYCTSIILITTVGNVGVVLLVKIRATGNKGTFLNILEILFTIHLTVVAFIRGLTVWFSYPRSVYLVLNSQVHEQLRNELNAKKPVKDKPNGE